MPKATVTFEKCIQDSQDYGSNDEHMVSRVFFTLDIDGRMHTGLFVDVKQTVGSSYEVGPIEVGSPKGTSYRGPWNHGAFCTAIEAYYRGLVGSAGTGIRIGSGATNIRMRNNAFIRQSIVEFDISGPETSW
jgi:hypothetical protein